MKREAPVRTTTEYLYMVFYFILFYFLRSKKCFSLLCYFETKEKRKREREKRTNNKQYATGLAKHESSKYNHDHDVIHCSTEPNYPRDGKRDIDIPRVCDMDGEYIIFILYCIINEHLCLQHEQKLFGS